MNDLIKSIINDTKSHKVTWAISAIMGFVLVLFCLHNYWVSLEKYISIGWQYTPGDINLAISIPIVLLCFPLVAILIRLGFWLVSLFISNPIIWFQNPHEKEDYKMPTETCENVVQVVIILRNRATRLRLQGTFILFLILFTLFGGLWLLQRAEESAPKVDNQRISQLKNRIDYYQMVIISPITEKQKPIKDFAFRYLSNDEDFIKSLWDAIDKIVPGLTEKGKKDRGLTKNDIKEQINNLVESPSLEVNNLKEYKNQLKETIVELKKDLQNEKIPPKDSGDANFTLVSLISTKIGVAVLLIFLVQILVTLYRYNARLASFYDARADALQIKSFNDDKMKSIISLLAADNLEFTKAPSPLSHKVIEKLEKILEAMNRKPE